MKAKKINRFLQVVPIEDIGKVLDDYRRSKGLSQKELSELCDVSEETISGLKRNADRVSMTILRKMLTALDIKMHFVFGLKEEDINRLTEL